MTTDWQPVASVPRNRPARKSTYGRRVKSDDKLGSGEWVVEGIHAFARAE